MDTDSLIKGLAADARLATPRQPAILAAALAAAVVAAGIVFFAALGPRPDIAAAAATLRFLAKFVLTLALAAAAAAALAACARPGASLRPAALLLSIAPLLAALAVAAELVAMPADAWGARWLGKNAVLCLTFIPLIGLGPLAVLLAALRRGAPTRPRLAGAVAGLAAGGIAATFYAAHCTDDSPLFVATWYTLAIAILALVGAFAGGRLLRW